MYTLFTSYAIMPHIFSQTDRLAFLTVGSWQPGTADITVDVNFKQLNTMFSHQHPGKRAGYTVYHLMVSWSCAVFLFWGEGKEFAEGQGVKSL